MAMNVGGRNGDFDALAELNTTPLIDVMLVLLVMLIITIPIQTHAIKLDMPRQGPAVVPQPIVHLVGVDFDGAITWDGAAVSRAELDGHFAKVAQQWPPEEVRILPDRLTRYDVVARLLADAQRAGVRHVDFAGEEQYAR